MKKFEIWIKRIGNNRTSFATYLGKYTAESFKDACKIALKENKYDMSYYDKVNNTYWGCKLFDNGFDATN